MKNFLESNGFIILLFVVIFFCIIFLTETIFGDLTTQDNYKPLVVVLPIMGALLGFLVYKSMKR